MYQHPTRPSEGQASKQSEESVPVSTVRNMIVGILLLGFISGGVAGALVPSVLMHTDSLPTGRDENMTNISRTVVVEESSAINTVKESTDSVVSIIIEKPASSATGGTVFNPFGFDFSFPGLEIDPGQPEPKADFDENIEPDYVTVGSGTGFVVSEDGLILTNKHVVNETDPEAIYKIVTKDGDIFEIEVLGVDPVNDLAVVKTKEEVDLKPLKLGDSDAIQIGQTVLAIGNSLGEFSNTVTKGVVSGLDRIVTASDGAGRSETIETAIQTDAAINPGNSGGPLLNIEGQVIGVNTAVSQQGQLIGFSIPINEAVRLIESIQEFGKVVRPYVGVRYVLIDKGMAKTNNLEVEYGALLRRGDDPNALAVIPGGPADKAGLEENDIILEVDGKRIERGNSLARILGKYRPGDEVILKVLKDGEEKEITIQLGEFEPEE